jgi:hypothetical protein
MRLKLHFCRGPSVFRVVFSCIVFVFISYFHRVAFLEVTERHLAINFSGLYAIAQVGVPRDVKVISGVSSWMKGWETLS